MQLRALSQSVPTPASPAPAASAPAAAPGPTSEPLDELIRGSQSSAGAAAAVENPWPELGKLAVLGGNVPVPGALGAVLTDETRKSLTAMFERLEAKGVKIERQRLVRLPFVMDKNVPLNPEQTVERLGKQKAQFKRLHAVVPGQANPVVLNDLKDVRALDAVYGAGVDVVAPRQAETVKMLDDFRTAGWNVRQSNYYYYEQDPSLSPLRAFRRMEDGHGVQLSKGDVHYDVKTPEDLRSLDFFHGTGQDRGLDDSVLAHRLKEAEGLGLRFVLENREATPRQVYLAKGQKMGIALKGAEYHLNLKVEDLSDADSMVSRLQDFEKVYARTVRPALVAADMKDWGATPATVLFPDDALALEARAAVFAELFTACAEGGTNRDTMQGTVNVYNAVRKGSPSAFEMARRAKLVLPTLRNSGSKAAVDFLARASQALSAKGGSKDADEKVQETFYKIMSATGSVEAAFEGVDLVRIAVGNERFEERLGIFLMIAAREGESTLGKTAEHYRSVLVHRDPKEGLVKTAERFLRLIEGMSVGRHQAHAPAVFAAVQADLVSGKITPSQADERVESFLRNLALSNDVDRAAEAMTSSAGGPAGEIKPGEDFVDIGGIRIPRSGG